MRKAALNGFDAQGENDRWARDEETWTHASCEVDVSNIAPDASRLFDDVDAVREQLARVGPCRTVGRNVAPRL